VRPEADRVGYRRPEEAALGIIGIDHIQLAMPAGGEEVARRFYSGLLGLPERKKPAHLAARGGVWFESHVYAQDPFGNRLELIEHGGGLR
jgi:hypothetical protein